MISRAAIIAITLLGLPLITARASAGPTMAFGYLVNESRDVNHEYLETIFPNSFASSIKNIFQVNVVKPGQIERLLEKQGRRLEKRYRPCDLMDLTDRIRSDYFIYGSFLTLPNNRIKIRLNLYSHGMNRIFSFTNIGRMEKEIFKLVDRITNIMIDFLGNNNFFMSRIVPRGKKIGILTNLEGGDLNSLYCAFLKGGYRIASMQGNSLYNTLSRELIGNFKYISAPENSYQIVSDPRAVRVLHSTWTGRGYYEEINYRREIYRIFDQNYMNEKSRALEKLAGRHNIDTVLIIGFNAPKTKAWVRCVDIDSKDLIWMESNIRGGITDVCGKILDRMSMEIIRK
ncbi:MAG: hypothetical protein JW807_04730 [Spirochaetes bacterium]|nr:hypothetical protein [Spirochaetota bacterium]